MVKDEDHFLEAFTWLLAVYILSKEDVLYQKIMKEANKLEGDGMKFEEAIAVVILKYKKAITIKSNSCKPSTDKMILIYGASLPTKMQSLGVSGILGRNVAVKIVALIVYQSWLHFLSIFSI